MEEDDTEIVSGLVVDEDESQPQPNAGGSYDQEVRHQELTKSSVPSSANQGDIL